MPNQALALTRSLLLAAGDGRNIVAVKTSATSRATLFFRCRARPFGHISMPKTKRQSGQHWGTSSPTWVGMGYNPAERSVLHMVLVCMCTDMCMYMYIYMRIDMCTDM